ncbi:hypothetical protein M513_08993 [Trichuris suis]|uniref:AAA+ ATPase domain-containing protein n=1 Tax=Trichuris suis TaxID=68888 RepID=A0A085LYV8_9BILA|nr:hypothetical protein M513_08993 [Trichuris suis]
MMRMDDEIAASYDPEDPLNWYLRCDEKPRDGKKRRLLEGDQLMDSTIEQILNVRRVAEPDGRFPSSGNGGKMDVCPTGYIFSIPPRDSDWIAVTLPDYYRMYLAMESTESSEEQRLCEQNASSGSSALCWQESGANRPRRHLLGHPFEELLTAAKQINEAECRRVTTLHNDIATDSSDWKMAKIASKEDLWSSKYQPRAYIDLLSDDGTMTVYKAESVQLAILSFKGSNRTLLTWLKLWDHCVFGKKLKRTGTMNDFVKVQSKPFHLSYENRRHQEVTAETLSRQLDTHGRPEFKVALLSGPPGIGKTTLAHMVARHCGYHVHEINASDDRTLESFSRLLSGALQMKRTLDASPKPHCVIVDEIDGAPTPSVNYLVALAKGGATNRKSRSMLLRRPIICICNDLYAPALRDLRRIALVLHVPPLETQRLAERLLQICDSEELNVEISVLRSLCQKADNDIRSCINTLQLLVCSGYTIRHSDVEKLTFGSKDSKKSLFDVWTEVFQLPRLKRLHECAGPMSENRYLDTRCEKVLTAVARCEQEDRLFDGLFENYPLIQFKDRHLRAIRAGLCWVVFMDRLNRLVGENQLFELLAYRRYVAVAFHVLFASNNFTKLNYPQRQKDVMRLVKKCFPSLQSASTSADLSMEIRALVDRSDLVIDVLPFLLLIVQPEITSNNPQLYTPHELSAFRNAARIMAEYNITYRQQKSANGILEAVMEPPLEDVALFAVEATYKPKLSYNARQAIAREAQALRLSSSNGEEQSEQKEQKPPSIVKQFCAHPSDIPQIETIEPDEECVPEKHFYAEVISSRIHPTVRKLLYSSNEEIASHYCTMHPQADRHELLRIMNASSKWYRWAGADLIRTVNLKHQERMVVIEMNSCPSGNKSVPFVDWGYEGYRRVMENGFLPILRSNGTLLPAGGLAVLYDVIKQRKESYAYALMLAKLTKEIVYLVNVGFDEQLPHYMRWSPDGVCQLEIKPGEWRDIRALFRYVTRKPWLKLPLLSKTMIVNPVIACLAGGRNKLVAAKAYKQFNEAHAGAGFKIHVPYTLTDVTKEGILKHAQRMNHQLVVKVPYSNCGVGVYTITCKEELQKFFDAGHTYDKYIVQSIISHPRWERSGCPDQLFHIGCCPKFDPSSRYVADLRFMISAGPNGWIPVAIYGRRAAKPLTATCPPGRSWDILGTNLSTGADGTRGTDTSRLILADENTFSDMSIGYDELVECYVQTVLAASAIDQQCQRLMSDRQHFDLPLFMQLDDDKTFVSEVARGCPRICEQDLEKNGCSQSDEQTTSAEHVNSTPMVPLTV